MWYGICNKDALGRSQYCPYNGTAKPVDSKTKELLSVWCSHLLVEDASNNVNTCCDSEQVSLRFRFFNVAMLRIVCMVLFSDQILSEKAVPRERMLVSSAALRAYQCC